MKNVIIIMLSLCILKVQAQNSDKNTIRLPLTFKDGFGPFFPGYAAVGWDRNDTTDAWYKTTLPVKGIPADWTDVKKGLIFFDIHQFVYQNYIAGNISKEFYKDLQGSWSWVPDTTHLSKKPLACYVYVVTGKNKAGQEMMLIDTANNLDVSNDIPFTPGKFNFKVAFAPQPLENIHHVTHERLENGKVVKVSSALIILRDSLHAWYSMPQYATTQLASGDSSITINAASTFTSDDLSHASVTLLQHSLYGTKGAGPKLSGAAPSPYTSKGEYMTIGDKLYCNKGVDDDGMLNLQQITDTVNLYSTQIGYHALPFSGKRFDTKEEVSLAALKGKYVFVDFWGTWCGPCMAEMPYLKKVYGSIDKNKVAFIGVVSDDTYETLKDVVTKQGLTWPQIISGGDDNIAGMYNINSYPSNFLIDPQGRIIARDLRGNALETKLKELVK